MPGEQLVDRLDRRADAGDGAEAMDRPRAGRERGLGGGEGLGRAGGHDRELALAGGDRAAAHRRIEQMQALAREALAEPAHVGGGDRAREHHRGALLQRRGGAAAAEQHVLDLGLVDHHHHQQVGALGRRARARRRLAAGGDQRIERRLPEVEAGHRAAGARQARRHAGAHRAEPDEADFPTVLHAPTAPRRDDQPRLANAARRHNRRRRGEVGTRRGLARSPTIGLWIGCAADGEGSSRSPSRPKEGRTWPSDL